MLIADDCTFKGFSHTNVKSKRWIMRYISKLCDEEVLEKVDSPNQSGNTPLRSVRLLKSDHQVDGKAFIRFE